MHFYGSVKLKYLVCQWVVSLISYIVIVIIIISEADIDLYSNVVNM